MKTVNISSFSDYIGNIFENEVNSHVYRGERLLSRPVLPKVGRIKNKDNKKFSPEDEKLILRAFTKRSLMLIPSPPSTDIEWLMIAQHHGLPTRLLDFTTNPLVGLYFSVEKPMNPGEETESSVVYSLQATSPKKQEGLNPFTIKQDTFINPFYSTIRMVSQQSRFMIFSDPLEPMNVKESIKYVIPHMVRKEVKKQLNRCGINKMNLFNSLDAVAEFLEWASTSNH